MGRLLHNVSTHPVCEYCGKPVKIATNNYSAFTYQHTCGDKECIYKYRRDYLSFKNDAVRNNAILKFKEKYNVDNPSQVPHIQKKINDTWKSHSEERTKEITDKRYQTSELLYNDKYYAARQGAKGAKEKWENISECERQLIYEKHKNSFRNTYGVDWYSKLPNHRNYISNLMKREDINSIRIQKYIKSFLEKHNITPVSEIHTMSELMLDPNVKAYRYNVMKKNNTFNSSKREDKIYSLLIEYFPDVIRQYTSVLYPFNCDFYIPSLDLYIEYNGSQFHLDHPFDENDESDIQILNNLTEKSKEKHKISNKSNQYDHMIFVWSINDVLKRNIAKENNLNYMEFWDLDGTDIKLWLKNLRNKSREIFSRLFYFINMKVIAFSDPHGYLPKVKDFPVCDVVCIAGDICPLDVQRDLVESISWFLLTFKPWAESLPCKKVIFVGGNHDFFLWNIGPMTNHTGAEVMKKLLGSHKGNSKLVYLQDSSFEFEGKRFYGTPWIEDLQNWAFYLPPEELEKKWSTIPRKFDVFISHMPPRRSGLGQVIQPGYNYGRDFGSQLLAEILGTRQFKYAICGHVHSGQHLPIDYCGCKYVNVSIKDEDYKVKYDLFEFEI